MPILGKGNKQMPLRDRITILYLITLKMVKICKIYQEIRYKATASVLLHCQQLFHLKKSQGSWCKSGKIEVFNFFCIKK